VTFEADLYAVLDAVSPGAFYPDFAPVDTPRPYGTYQAIGGPVLNQLDGQATGLRTQEWQINVWADTREQARTLIRAVEAAMRAATAFQAQPMSEPVDDFDADIPVYGSLQSFNCRFHE
jgi:hypothetical protein